MSQTVKTAPTGAPAEASNRVKLGLSNRLLARPEVGALVAAIVIFIFFLVVAPSFRSPPSFFTVLYQSSTIGIVAVGGRHVDDRRRVRPVGRRHRHDRRTVQRHVLLPARHQPVGRRRAVSLVFCLAIGFFNGYMVMRTGIPIVPDHPRHLLRPARRQPRRHQARHRLGVQPEHQPDGRLRLAALHLRPHLPDRLGAAQHHRALVVRCSSPSSACILQRTKIGNWIYAVGGNEASARAVGVPVTRVKIGLFMTVSLPRLVRRACTTCTTSTSSRPATVSGNEFLYIIAAVVGGTLMTGGYGNAIGVAIGAFIFGMTSLGIVYAGWDPNWFRAFLGVMLLLAVMVNLYVKKLSTTRKVG